MKGEKRILRVGNYCVVSDYKVSMLTLYSQPIKTRHHIKSCLHQRDCQRNIKIVALLTSVRLSCEAKFKIFSKPQKAQLKGLGPL